MKELQLSWKTENPVKLYSGLRMPQFEVEHVTPNVCQESFQIGETQEIMHKNFSSI
jgi:hypothetical protein